jgi:60S ribosome subunit biogenesis protein NIP7
MVELANYIGKNLVHLIDREEDDAYCFRLHKDR